GRGAVDQGSRRADRGSGRFRGTLRVRSFEARRHAPQAARPHPTPPARLASSDRPPARHRRDLSLVPSARRDVTGLPRLLFVTPCAFNHLTGSGITFTNLFRTWPSDRIATAHSDHV